MTSAPAPPDNSRRQRRQGDAPPVQTPVPGRDDGLEVPPLPWLSRLAGDYSGGAQAWAGSRTCSPDSNGTGSNSSAGCSSRLAELGDRERPCRACGTGRERPAGTTFLFHGGERCGNQNRVVLPAAIGGPGTLRSVHVTDGAGHRARQRGARQRKRSTRREQGSAARFGDARGNRVGLARLQPKRLEEATGALGTVAAEPAE